MKDLVSSLGPVSAVIGAQWGDEGKGKIIDILAEHYDVIARACGGANAGHTIVVGGKKHVFRLLPSGALHAASGKDIFLGAGMVIHIPTLMEEIGLLENAGVAIRERLWISGSAHVVFEYHKDIDALQEERRGDRKIGTTKRGIGPAFADKAARCGLRFSMMDTDEAIHMHLRERERDIRDMYGAKIDVKDELNGVLPHREFLASRTARPDMLHDLIRDKRRVLIEGAQATLLDIDHGTYPYVTSSSTTASGALQGLGLPPKALKSCIGVAKAYCTRVGEGAFVTEAEEEAAKRLRERGGEYGSVTGRPRRCGWLHLPDLRYSAHINGFDCWNITKLDVLDTEPEILVGTGVSAAGKPAYERLPGWKQPTTGIRKFDDLPQNARQFIEFIEKQTLLPVRLIGTGPGREEMIVR